MINSRAAVIVGLLPTMVAWGLTLALILVVVRNDDTRFSPTWLAALLLAVVVVGSAALIRATARALRGAGWQDRRELITFGAASLVVWTASLSLGFVTIRSIA